MLQFDKAGLIDPYYICCTSLPHNPSFMYVYIKVICSLQLFCIFTFIFTPRSSLLVIILSKHSRRYAGDFANNAVCPHTLRCSD